MDWYIWVIHMAMFSFQVKVSLDHWHYKLLGFRFYNLPMLYFGLCDCTSFASCTKQVDMCSWDIQRSHLVKRLGQHWLLVIDNLLKWLCYAYGLLGLGGVLTYTLGCWLFSSMFLMLWAMAVQTECDLFIFF